MKPYYEQDGITIYHADSWPLLRDNSIEYSVFITDPPYGVELGTSDSRGDGHGLAYQGYDGYADTINQWRETVIPVIGLMRSTVSRGAVFAGKHVTELPAPSVVGGVYVPAAVGRNPWGFTNLMTVFFYGSNPKVAKGAHQTVLRSVETAEANGHPCPKPIGWMRWLVNLAALPNDVICDPFMGSGTTLVAAKQLGYRAIGIEISERYCEIAAKRLSQGALPMEFSA